MWYNKKKPYGDSMKIRDYDLILWDFNGTLLDDLQYGIDTVNVLLRKRALPTLDTVEAYYGVFGFPVKDYYEKIGLWRRDEDFSPVANEWMDRYRAYQHTVGLRPGVEEVLSAILASDTALGVLSATETEMLKGQLAERDILSRFSVILGRDDIYASDKSGLARTYRAAHPDARVLMIGDTSHDLTTARAGGFDCLLVAGGHESEASLLASGAPVAKDIYDVGRYLGIWER